jgi:hypothetical protein
LKQPWALNRNRFAVEQNRNRQPEIQILNLNLM